MLRFPEFSGEWTQYKLGECFDERNEQFPESSDYPLMAFIAGKGVTEKGEKYDRSALVKDAPNKKYKRTELGDFIYSSNNLESGSIGLNRYGKACISPVYSIFKMKKGFDPYFIGTILTQKSFISEMIKYRQGVVYGQWKIPEKEFLNLIIRIPSFGEQQRIAEFLEAEDRLISAQEQKVESLKAHKKGLMQQLFPQPGATTPVLRFPGFTGEWQEKPLSHFLHEHKTKSDGKCEVHSVSVTKGVINQVEYLGRSFAASDTSKYNLAKPGDIIYTKSPTGAFPYGIVKQNNNPYNVIVSPLYAVYTPVNQYVGYILDSYFESSVNTNNYLSSLIQKGAKNTIQISNDTFVSKSMCLPSDPAEQQKIAECLETLDNLIVAESKKVGFLKAHKKGLMQQLFPQPVK